MRLASRCLAALSTFAIAAPVLAQLSPGPNPLNTTVNTAQTLSGGTGTITSTGVIQIPSGNSAALTMTGTSTLINNGLIQQSGTGRAIDSNSGVANLNITNNGFIGSTTTDAFRVNTNSAVLLNNFGTIRVT